MHIPFIFCIQYAFVIDVLFVSLLEFLIFFGLMKIIFNFLVLHVLTVNSLLNFELLFSFCEYFSSDVVLLAISIEKGIKEKYFKILLIIKKIKNFFLVELAKRFYKYQTKSPKAFLGIFNLDQNVNQSMPRIQLSKYQNIIIASDCGEYFIKKLIEV